MTIDIFPQILGLFYNMIRFLIGLIFIATNMLAAPSLAGLNEKSVLNIEASKAAVAGDYQKAISYYNRLIQIDPDNTHNYVQRGFMYREAKNLNRSKRDATIALQLANIALEKKSTGRRGAKNYWQRAMANRLLKNFDEAKADLTHAIRLKRDQRWLRDLQAIELESRIHGSGR